MSPWVPVLLQAAPNDPLDSWMTPLVSLGGFGLLLILLLTDRLYTRSAYQEMKAERDSYKRTTEILLANEQTDLKRDEVIHRIFEEIREIARDRDKT
jgi:hypothetical protein